jgi:hypothetical protein
VRKQLYLRFLHKRLNVLQANLILISFSPSENHLNQEKSNVSFLRVENKTSYIFKDKKMC